MKAEIDRLRANSTWYENDVEEWDDVAQAAIDNGETVHFGYLFGICVEKGYELPKGHPDRKY